MKRAVQGGSWVLGEVGKVDGCSKFQQRRLTTAVTTARLYLEGPDAAEIAKTLRVTPERAAQVVRIGISYLRKAGWLRPAVAGPSSATRRP
jgi:hypothetical protein